MKAALFLVIGRFSLNKKTPNHTFLPLVQGFEAGSVINFATFIHSICCILAQIPGLSTGILSSLSFYRG